MCYKARGTATSSKIADNALVKTVLSRHWKSDNVLLPEPTALMSQMVNSRNENLNLVWNTDLFGDTSGSEGFTKDVVGIGGLRETALPEIAGIAATSSRQNATAEDWNDWLGAQEQDDAMVDLHIEDHRLTFDSGGRSALAPSAVQPLPLDEGSPFDVRRRLFDSGPFSIAEGRDEPAAGREQQKEEDEDSTLYPL